VRVFLERDLKQADASVSVERAQAHAGRSREGATGFSPAQQVRPPTTRAAGCSWSAVYRLAEVERGRNTRTASAASTSAIDRLAEAGTYGIAGIGVALAPRGGTWPGWYMSRQDRPTRSRMPKQ
jgi:hypothetical protein